MNLSTFVKALNIFEKYGPDQTCWFIDGNDHDGCCQFDTTGLSEEDRQQLLSFGFKSTKNENSESEWFDY